MTARLVIDTNVLVYAQDAAAGWKRESALTLLERLAAGGSAVITAQVLGEYFSVVTRKFPESMPPGLAADQVDRFASLWTVLPTDARVVLTAVRGVVRHGLPYYDAQVWAAARLNGIGCVLSEDFSDGREVEGVRFADPFARGFELDALLCE